MNSNLKKYVELSCPFCTTKLRVFNTGVKEDLITGARFIICPRCSGKILIKKQQDISTMYT